MSTLVWVLTQNITVALSTIVFIVWFENISKQTLIRMSKSPVATVPTA